MDAVLDAAIADIHPFYGDEMSLNFANTLEPRGGPPPIEIPPGVELRDDLMSYPHLVAWTHLAGGYDREVATTLVQLAESKPEESDRVLLEAFSLRDVLYRVFWSVAEARAPLKTDLLAMRESYLAAIAGATLVQNATWTWRDTRIHLALPLAPVARSAIGLLTQGRLDRIKICPGKGRPPVHCAWLFLDTTKNGSRRWCSMADCGAAEKARQQTARRRAGREKEVT